MRHVATFLQPGFFMPEESSKEVPTRDPSEVAKLAPAGTYCFTLHDKEDNGPDLGPDYRVVPVAKNKSGRFYIGGTLHSLDEVTALGHDILASNMRANRWDRVIHCPTGNWQPFTDDDIVIEVD